MHRSQAPCIVSTDSLSDGTLQCVFFSLKMFLSDTPLPTLVTSKVVSFKIHLFIYWLWWVFTAPGGLSLVAASKGYCLAAVYRLLTAVVSLVVEHRL